MAVALDPVTTVWIAVAAVVLLPFAVFFRALALVRGGGVSAGQTLYTPQRFALTDVAEVQKLMRDIAFAELITVDAQTRVPFISHIPLLFVPPKAGAPASDLGRLQGHVAATNPQWQHFASQPHGGQVLCVFNGPHAYVSPHNYSRTTRQVPTWNYATVHATGVVQIISSAQGKADAMKALIQRFESERVDPWPGTEPAVFDAVSHMLADVVYFDIRITRLEAKVKLSQQRATADWTALHTAFSGAKNQDKQALAAMMRHYCPSKFPAHADANAAAAAAAVPRRK